MNLSEIHQSERFSINFLINKEYLCHFRGCSSPRGLCNENYWSSLAVCTMQHDLMRNNNYFTSWWFCLALYKNEQFETPLHPNPNCLWGVSRYENIYKWDLINSYEFATNLHNIIELRIAMRVCWYNSSTNKQLSTWVALQHIQTEPLKISASQNMTHSHYDNIPAIMTIFHYIPSPSNIVLRLCLITNGSAYPPEGR